MSQRTFAIHADRLHQRLKGGWPPVAGQMVVRWVATGVLDAVKGFRRLKGHKAMP